MPKETEREVLQGALTEKVSRKRVNKTVEDLRCLYQEASREIADDVLSEAAGAVERALLEYYNSPEGKYAISRSPHHNKEPEEVVALIMDDVWVMHAREVRARKAKAKQQKQLEVGDDGSN